ILQCIGYRTYGNCQDPAHSAARSPAVCTSHKICIVGIALRPSCGAATEPFGGLFADPRIGLTGRRTGVGALRRADAAPWCAPKIRFATDSSVEGDSANIDQEVRDFSILLETRLLYPS